MPLTIIKWHEAKTRAISHSETYWVGIHEYQWMHRELQTAVINSAWLILTCRGSIASNWKRAGTKQDRLAQCVKLATLDGAPQLINGYAVWLGGIFICLPPQLLWVKSVLHIWLFERNKLNDLTLLFWNRPEFISLCTVCLLILIWLTDSQGLKNCLIWFSESVSIFTKITPKAYWCSI